MSFRSRSQIEEYAFRRWFVRLTDAPAGGRGREGGREAVAWAAWWQSVIDMIGGS